jgi:hypothetical protein
MFLADVHDGSSWQFSVRGWVEDRLLCIRVDHQSINVNITTTLMELTLYVSTSSVD